MTLIGKHILLGFCLFGSLLGMAQQGKLTGHIKDAVTGDPLVGATVFIIGTYKGVSTDFDGNYTLGDIKPGDYSIKVSFIGYADKVFNGITISKNKTTSLNTSLTLRSETLEAVTIVGQKSLVDLESAASEVTVTSETIEQMNARNVTEVLSMQAGVSQSPDGLQVRGGRVYETQYMIDGISAQDPLAGSGFGVEVAANSINDLQLITGGAGAEFGDGTAGVISTQIKEGGETFQIAGSWTRDNLWFDQDAAHSWDTDFGDLSLGGAIGKKKKFRYFFAGHVRLSNEYFGETANQLHSSLFTGNDSIMAPRYSNDYSTTAKFSYMLKPGTKITLTNQYSLKVNQNSRTLQIIGFDAVLQPGYQYRRSLQLDNATTYTHQSNLIAANLNHFLNDRWNMDVTVGRLFVNLRADANGRPFRTETVDQILDEQSVITDPVELFNPDDNVVYTLPDPWFYNNGGIAGVWHDHYVDQYTIKYRFKFYPNNKVHKISFGHEHMFIEYQWADVFKPWVGAPIEIDEETTSPSTRIGASNDIWTANPQQGGFYAQDVITYKGIIATIGMRLNYWAPGKYADDAVANPESPVIDQIREDYIDDTFGFGGLRWKARLMPKINVSFPVTENNVLFFNYGHYMRLPHPRFVYQGLNPEYLNNSFLDDLGNPNLNPEVSVNYELGLKTQVNKNMAFTVSAFNNNRFDYIVSRSVIVEDNTGRPVSKRMYINQDYANIYGIEVGNKSRFGKNLTGFFSVAYQVARGKSNSARESGLQIEQNGEVSLTTENYLAWDRPWDMNAGIMFNPDTNFRAFGKSMNGFSAFINFSYTSGFRYTPYEYVGTNELGRPLYEIQNDKYLQETAAPWINLDLKLSQTIFVSKEKRTGLILTFEIRNMLNRQNAQIINPITGRAYEEGDDLTEQYRDPRYIGPEENGAQPMNPARYLAPRQLLYGLAFKF